MLWYTQKGGVTILVCDPTGDSIAPTLVALAKLLLERVCRACFRFICCFRNNQSKSTSSFPPFPPTSMRLRFTRCGTRPPSRYALWLDPAYA